MRFTPTLDGLEARRLATILPPGIVALVPLDGGIGTPTTTPDPTQGPINTITGQPAPNPLPDFTPSTPGANPE